MVLDDKTILVTGGTGSFGQAFVRLVLKEYNPRAIRVFSNEEHAQWDMSQKNTDARVRFLIGDVRDKDRLSRAMNGVDIVVHAAALKQIVLGEYNPLEVVQTNIMGTANVADAALDNNIEKAIFISSDKAVNPVNLYGATKLCGERLFVHANVYRGPERNTKLSCARYGNVIGSQGSVIPLFLEQKKTGTITITDERMTRFWITLEQGVRFVIDSIERMQGGEIFVPKIPSMKVVDLATVVAPGSEIQYIGIRPSEKLHEVLLSGEEARRTKEFSSHFVIQSELALENTQGAEGVKVAENFVYSSDLNTQWLTKEEMQSILQVSVDPR